jgi:hypothetical protein
MVKLWQSDSSKERNMATEAQMQALKDLGPINFHQRIRTQAVILCNDSSIRQRPGLMEILTAIVNSGTCQEQAQQETSTPGFSQILSDLIGKEKAISQTLHVAGIFNEQSAIFWLQQTCYGFAAKSSPELMSMSAND